MKDITQKLPQEFIHKLKKIYPFRYQKIVATFTGKRKSSFRINYLKTELRDLRRSLLHQHVRFKEVSFPKGAFVLNTDLRKFQTTEIYNQGLVYVQNVSSMIPPIVLDPKEGDKILDLCAAPGAKTTQLTSLTAAANNVEIIAVEKIRNRYYKLLANLDTQGAKDKVQVLLLDGIWVRKKFPEYFDKILVDAPCSAEGRFQVHNPRTYKYWKNKKIKEMVSKQKKLMHAAFFALKEGGELVYSTCTFSPEENEGIIDWFLNKFKNKVELLPIQLPISNICDGLQRWKDKKYNQSLRRTKRIIPNDFMEGFFIAKLRKVSE